MDKLVVEGGLRLSGTVEASGSKNAALPLLFASILSGETVEFHRVPELKDISTTFELLRGLGVEVVREGGVVKTRAPKLSSCEAPYDLVRTMRASILALGPLLAREHRARVSLPGGCAIGTRPVDLHLFGLERMGARFIIQEGYINGACPGGLVGAEIPLRVPSVGATENIMLAATLARGTTVIGNAAREPEIVNLAVALRAMGAKVSGEGTERITILGVNALRGGKVDVMFDRIEAGTLLLAGPISGGSVRVEKVDPRCLGSFLDELKRAGVAIEVGGDWMSAAYTDKLQPVNFATAPFPGFPTDLQAQFMALLTQVEGVSEIEETIFENRFMHVPELNRLGARISVQGARARIEGESGRLNGATVMATDLRASASLVLAGLAAKGTTHVRRIYHLDRGYERIEAKLERLGAKIRRSEE